MIQNAISITKQIGFLTIALTIALAANLTYGQWTDPGADAPNGNIEAPINTSSVNQIKVGDVGVASMYVADTTYSDRYCDFSGTNCIDGAVLATGGNSLPSCADGDVLKFSGGSIVCGNDETGGSSDTDEFVNIESSPISLFSFRGIIPSPYDTTALASNVKELHLKTTMLNNNDSGSQTARIEARSVAISSTWTTLISQGQRSSNPTITSRDWLRVGGNQLEYRTSGPGMKGLEIIGYTCSGTCN